MTIEIVPDWMAGLEEEDVTFIKRFVLSSGSLKDMASQYGVTYPTVRLRLDKLIQKIEMEEEKGPEPYVDFIKKLALNDKLDFATAKLIINEYRKDKQNV